MFAPLSVCRDYQYVIFSHADVKNCYSREHPTTKYFISVICGELHRENRTAATTLGCNSLGNVCMCVQWMVIGISVVFVEFGPRS